MLSSNIKKKKPILYGGYAVLLLAVFLFEYSNSVTAPIGKPSVSVILPLVITAAILFKEWAGGFYGLTVGIAMDIVTNGSFFFNAVILFVIAVAAGLIISRVFLNNTISAILLLSMGIVVYYILKWFFLCLLAGNTEPFLFLVKITLPSAFLTVLFGIPIFYLVRLIARKIIKQ